jgi:hypothetical protein
MKMGEYLTGNWKIPPKAFQIPMGLKTSGFFNRTTALFG